MLLDFLRDYPGRLFKEWDVLNRICVRGSRRQNRIERMFLMRQLNRLVRERKIIRYYRRLNRGKIRISEAFV